jgi:hypothetical protein
MLKYDRAPAYFPPDLAQLEKQRGKLGMTWRLKVQGVVIVVLVLVSLALSMGAAWIDASSTASTISSDLTTTSDW